MEFCTFFLKLGDCILELGCSSSKVKAFCLAGIEVRIVRPVVVAVQYLWIQQLIITVVCCFLFECRNEVTLSVLMAVTK